MSTLYRQLSEVYERGHAQALDGLLSDARFAPGGKSAQAAVLIAVTNCPERPGVILTKRREDMRSHPGQVAFPGGRLDPGEDAIAAALREAHEELALDPRCVQVIGPTDRYLTGTGFDITPVLGVVPPSLDLVPNPQEVDAWFEAPLDLLLDARNWNRREAFWRGATRGYLEMDYKGFRIWGVTAAILFNLARRLESGGLKMAAGGTSRDVLARRDRRSAR